MLVSRLVTGVRGSLAAAFSLLPRDPAITSRGTAWGKAAAAGTGGGGAGWQRAEVGTGGMSRGCHNTARFATQAIPAKACVERPVLDVTKAKVDTRTTTVTFSDNTSSAFPFVWLRENCQCSTCFQSDAIARLFLIDDLDVHIQPKEVQVTDGSLRMEWQDGHVSVFTGEWLRRRAFTPDSRAAQRTWCMLEKKLWSSEFEVPRSKYSTVMHNDKALLDWLVVLEKYGVTVVEEAPRRVGAINDFIERLGVLKPTHYGRDYEIVTHVTPNNLAYTGARLGLHTDLPYCEYPPGTTWLHCIRQCMGEGGENDLSDGFYAAEKLKERHPHHFETLVNTPIYFQDRGYALYDFDKITPRTSISLDHLGKICRIHVSSQSRDSLMDLDPEGVIRFYEALKAYNDTLRESGVLVKTKPGDILVIDNTRVLHGRTPFDPSISEGPRHIHNAYIDLDDLRSKRRILQEKLGIELS